MGFVFVNGWLSSYQLPKVGIKDLCTVIFLFAVLFVLSVT